MRRCPPLLTVLVLLVVDGGVDARSDERRQRAVRAVAVEADRTVLRVRNRTPFLLNLYVAGVRVGWLKPLRTETFSGLRSGYHEIYATSHYGSGHWGPRRHYVPGTWTILPSEGSMSGDASTALVSRIYRDNRSSLQACDSLARRRGEELAGARAGIEIRVNARGQGTVRVRGPHLSERLRACYLAVSSRWKLPVTGEAYEVAFEHIHFYGR